MGHCWSSIKYVLQGLITKQIVHVLKKVGEAKNQICSSGFCTWPAFWARSKHNAIPLEGPLHGNGFYGGLF